MLNHLPTESPSAALRGEWGQGGGGCWRKERSSGNDSRGENPTKRRKPGVRASKVLLRSADDVGYCAKVAERRAVECPGMKKGEIYKVQLYPHRIILIGFEFNSASGPFTLTASTCCISVLRLQLQFC